MKRLFALLCILGAAGLSACNPGEAEIVVQALSGSTTTTTSTTAPPTTTTTTPPPPTPQPPPGSATACGQDQGYRDKMAPIPCSEVDRAVSEAAVEFKIDEVVFRRVAQCESHFVPTAGSYYRGLLQESSEFFKRWLPRFNAAVEPDLGAGRPYPSRDHPWDNARLAAYVISLNGYDEWGICA